MKKVLAIVLATFALSVFAAEPATPVKAPTEMKLAKKKDHSKDKKVVPTKSRKAKATKK